MNRIINFIRLEIFKAMQRVPKGKPMGLTREITLNKKWYDGI